MKHIIVGIITAAIIPGGFWIFGFNFNERGPVALGCYIASLCFAAFAIACSKDLAK